jgi:hypothetical protein
MNNTVLTATRARPAEVQRYRITFRYLSRDGSRGVCRQRFSDSPARYAPKALQASSSAAQRARCWHVSHGAGSHRIAASW